MRDPCKGCPKVRTSRCRDCLLRRAYLSYRRKEERWQREQNILAKDDQLRLVGGKTNKAPKI